MAGNIFGYQKVIYLSMQYGMVEDAKDGAEKNQATRKMNRDKRNRSKLDTSMAT
jgi:hypothetical protein